MDCFKKWRKDISKFIWSGRKPRIKHQILIDKKERGGFALPELEIYHTAAALTWLKDWIDLENPETLDLEGFDNRFGWHSYLLYGKVSAHKGFLNHIIRKSLFKIWTKHRWMLEPKIPLWTSPIETITVRRKNMQGKWARYRTLIKEENGNIVLKEYKEISNQLTGWLQYFQLNERFKTDKKEGIANETSKFEAQLIQSKGKYISKMYDLILEWETKEELVKSAMIKWAQDIGHNIFMTQWEKLWKDDIRFTACINLRENVMKMIYRWHYSPVKLSKMF